MICHIDLKPQESVKQMWGIGFSLCIPIVEMLLGMLLLFCIDTNDPFQSCFFDVLSITTSIDSHCIRFSGGSTRYATWFML